METSTLHERIRLVVGNMTNRALGELTAHNPETVRRYMQGAAPSVEFLSALCAKFELNAQWLLVGRGPMKQSENRAYALREADSAKLLGMIADGVEKLSSRVDRVERFVQALEKKLRESRARRIQSSKAPAPSTSAIATPEQPKPLRATRITSPRKSADGET